MDIREWCLGNYMRDMSVLVLVSMASGIKGSHIKTGSTSAITRSINRYLRESLLPPLPAFIIKKR